MFRITTIASVALLGVGAANAASECKMMKYAELPITMHGTRPLVKGTINGKPALFMADSATFFSMLRPGSEQKFGFRLDPLPKNLTIKGTNGSIDAKLGTTKTFSLDGLLAGREIPKVEFIVGGRAMPDGEDGIIGQNVLGNADAEYDFANGIIRLFKAKDCGNANLAYWKSSSPLAIIDIDSKSQETNIVGRALLNGKSIRVIFDSGASGSVLTRYAAEKAGVNIEDDNVLAGGLSQGIAQKRVENWIARFDSLDLGGEVIKNARLRIANISINGDMLLGSDFFLSHRIIVSNSQRKLYFTYNGGPVFDLGDNRKKIAIGNASQNMDSATQSVSETESSSSSSQSKPQESLDAAGYKRRAAASAARRDFLKAISDFDAALKFDATDVESYLQRGRAHLGNREPLLAMSDFDQAIKIKPDFTEALAERGMLRLVGRNDVGAGEDFDAAIRSAPDNRNIELEVAQRYLELGRLDLAIHHFDIWIGANPKDNRMPVVLTQRCRARAFANKELDLALNDCDSALHKTSKDSRMLDNRALVYLRLGNHDKAIADYKASLKLQPKNAWTLFGLGIAERNKGLLNESEKDFQAALLIAPGVEELYKRIGLSR